MRDFDRFPLYESFARNYWVFHTLRTLLLLAVLAMLVYLTIATIRRSRNHPPAAAAAPSAAPAAGAPASETPLDVVKMRYARGEITSEEFEKLKQDLQ